MQSCFISLLPTLIIHKYYTFIKLLVLSHINHEYTVYGINLYITPFLKYSEVHLYPIKT